MSKKSEYFEKDHDVENVGNIRYCLVCPTDQQELMKKSFIDAGIIEEHEFEHRLNFVTTAKAITHHQLFLDKLNWNQK